MIKSMQQQEQQALLDQNLKDPYWWSTKRLDEEDEQLIHTERSIFRKKSVQLSAKLLEL